MTVDIENIGRFGVYFRNTFQRNQKGGLELDTHLLSYNTYKQYVLSVTAKTHEDIFMSNCPFTFV